MPFVAALLYLTKTRLALTTLAVLGFFLAPRWDCTWQVEQLRFNSLRVGLASLDLEMDVGLRVWNPNHVPARLLDASLALFRVQPPSKPHTGGSGAFLFPSAAAAATDSPAPPPSPPNPTPTLPPVRGPAFGTATVRRPQRVPRRGSFSLEAVHVSLPQLPLPTAVAMLWDLITGLGRLQVRAMGTARVRAARSEVEVYVDCLQEVRVLLHAIPQITRSECVYALGAPAGADGFVGVGSWLEEGLASMDFCIGHAGGRGGSGGTGGSGGGGVIVR